jgi:hypothetical protein
MARSEEVYKVSTSITYRQTFVCSEGHPRRETIYPETHRFEHKHKTASPSHNLEPASTSRHQLVAKVLTHLEWLS